MSKGIPQVKKWKVRAVETGRTVEVWTINRRFARLMSMEQFGMYGQTLKVSLDRGPFAKDFKRYGFSQPIELD